MNHYNTIIRPDQIQARVNELAKQISSDYEGKNPVLVSLLKGAYIFMADLSRKLTIPHEIDFISISSYRNGSLRSDEIEILNELRCDIGDRDVIIVEGIIDTGHTVSRILKDLESRNARGIRVCTLLNKKSSREIDVPIHYVGFTIPDVFVVGYGLDFMERYRNLAGIAELPEMFDARRSPGGEIKAEEAKESR